jgi:TP901 family phage tail tape measure protein
MNNEFTLAMQLTMVDMLSGVAQTAKRHIQALGDAGKEVSRDFDLMTAHIGRGLKSVAVANYGINKMKPGVAAAAELQDSMIDVRMSLMRSGQEAATLGSELKQVRDTATALQKIAPFSAVDVVQVQKELLNSGVEFENVIGRGAARAAITLATITKEGSEAATNAMLNVGIPYHLKGGEYGQVADVIQRHVMSGRMKLGDLNAGLPYVAPVAKNFKVPWEDLLTGMAVLGEQGQLGSTGGTHLKDYYQRLTGASRISRRVMQAVNRDLISKGKAPLEFWDKNGEMLPTYQQIKNMRSSLGNYNTKHKSLILEKIFGEQGGLAALALMSQGTGSWEFIKEKVEKVAGAEEKMNERLKGFSANVTALGGTTKTTLANLFDPMLEPLTKGLQLTNDLVDAVGRLAGEHKTAAAIGDAALGIGVGVAGAYGVYNLVKGAGYGRKVLSGLGGLKGLSSLGFGVAEGKAVQAATGVNPVFVTNWPAGFGGAAAAEAASVATASAGRALPWMALAGGTIAGAAIAGVPVSKVISDAMRENGWSSRTITRSSREYEVMGIGSRRGEVKNDIRIDLQIDSNGRVFTRSNDMGTNISTLKRGKFFEGMMTGH